MNEEEHNSFCYKIEGDADTGLSDYEQPADEDQAMIFKHPHGLVTAGECIRSYYERIKQSDVTSMYDYAIYLMHRLYEDFFVQILYYRCKYFGRGSIYAGIWRVSGLFYAFRAPDLCKYIRF